MVKLGFNAHGFIFQDAVNSVLHSFNAANQALTAELVIAETAAAAFKPNPDAEPDDSGFDEAEFLAYRIEAAESALQTFRKAFALILYHTWERAARRWVQVKSESHDDLTAAVTKAGVPLHPTLKDLRILVNTLKHNKAKWGKELAACQSGAFFDPGFSVNGTRDWYEAIKISPAMMVKLFDAVSGSGPNVHSASPQ